MTKPVITTRASKGSALTYTELDTNFTNLDNATITVTGDTGTITNNLNDSFKISGGTGLTSSVSGTTLTLNLDNTAVTPGSYTAANITVDAQGRITAASAGSASNFASPPAIGNTTTNTGAFTTLTANLYTGQIYVPGVNPSSSYYIGFYDQSGPNAGTTPYLSTNIVFNNSTNTLSVNGSGGSISATGTISALNLSGALNGTVGATTPNTGAFTTLTASTSIAGPLKNYSETVQAMGSQSGAVVMNAANGNVKTLTLTGNLTLNSFTSPVAGQSITLIITHFSSNNVLSSTMKFSNGGSKTLSTTAGAIDVIHMFYDGTNYYASLTKGFA